MRRGCVGRRYGDWARERLSAAVRLALLALVGLAPAAAASDPVPAPLSPVPAAPASPADDAPARALPATVTICRAGTSTRCWVRPGDDPCTPDGEPFRVVPDRAADVATALAACRTPADSPGTPHPSP